MTSGQESDEPALDLDAIQARCDAATAGPWFAASHNKRKDGIALVGAFDEQGSGKAIAVLAGIQVRQRHRDAVFVAHARTDMPRLIARIKTLQNDLQSVLDARDPAAQTAAQTASEPPARVPYCAAVHRPDPRMKGFYVCNQEPGHEGDHEAAGFDVRWPRTAADRCPPARTVSFELSGTADV